MSAVLIVDDEAGVREILRRWLEPDGYAIREAPNANAALEALAAAPADAILCDVQMPGHDGLWLVARVRERFPNMAVVLATAEDMVSPVVTLQPGVVAYVVKPFQKVRVLAAVKDALAWSEAAAALGASETKNDDPIDQWLGRGLTARARQGEDPDE